MSDRLGEGVTLILGGARSGKSRFAERLVTESGLSRVYLATGRAFDDEMRERIAHHRASRGDGWRTIETPTDLADAIRAEAERGTAILVDCLTLWLTNLMMDDRPVAPACDTLVESLRGYDGGPLVLVSNEVGLGIVPDNAMARAFRDHAGRLHQSIGALADTVYFVAAGLPIRLKG